MYSLYVWDIVLYGNDRTIPKEKTWLVSQSGNGICGERGTPLLSCQISVIQVGKVLKKEMHATRIIHNHYRT